LKPGRKTNRPNLTLNRAKTIEIIFTDGKRRRQVNAPTPLQDIQRATSLKILGVTVTKKLSISDHVSNVIRACAQSLHAIRVLRCHGMCNSALQTIYRAVIVSKLFHASNEWRGFTAADRQRLSAFLRRGVRAGLYGADDPSVTQIVDDADDKLFRDIIYQTHIIQYTTSCPNRPHTNTNLKPGATIDSYSVNRSLTTVILSPDFCLKTVINHASSSPFIYLCCLSLRIVLYSRVTF